MKQDHFECLIKLFAFFLAKIDPKRHIFHFYKVKES